MGVVLYTLLVGSESNGPYSQEAFLLDENAGADQVDTPWDEPSENSPEYRAFLTGELLNYDPWTRIRGQARGGSWRSVELRF